MDNRLYSRTSIPIKDLLDMAMFEDPEVSELVGENPKQFLSTELRVPVWKVEYSYTTVRNNFKKGVKYIFHRADYWDSIEVAFLYAIEDFNNSHKDRQLSNVKILDCSYLGEMIIPLS